MSISHSSNLLTNINYESCIQCAKCHTNCVIETSLFKTESDKMNGKNLVRYVIHVQ